jgi:spoIIIJ-associated protein
MNQDSKADNLNSRVSLEEFGGSVEEAIAKGLDVLGIGEDQVDIEILDEGSRGVLGIGSRQARVRLTVRREMEVESLSDESSEGIEAEQEPFIEVEEEEGEWVSDEAEPHPEATNLEEIAIHIAKETVVDLLERMHVNADVEAYLAEPDDDRSRRAIWVDITGDDLSILIGHHAETLQALQYITSLILGKELGRSIPMVIDVQGYRKRRAGEVQRLARQMADQAVKSGRRQVLEPMPPNERRLVHIELRKNPLVTTESIGEEPRRKVTIIPVDQDED